MQDERLEDDLTAAVAAELRAEKARRRLTNKVLSERSGIPEVTVQRKLAGDRDIRMMELYAIAKAMGCDPGAIISAAVERLDADPMLVDAVQSGIDAATRPEEEESRQGNPDAAVTDEAAGS